MDAQELKELTRYIEQPLTIGDVEEKGAYALEVAQGLVITTQVDADKASADRDDMTKKIDSVLAKIKPFKQRAHKIHKYFKGLENTLELFEDARKLTNEKLVEHELKKREDAERAQKEADDRAVVEAAIKVEQEGNSALSDAILDGSMPVYAEPVAKVKTKGTIFADTYDYEVLNIDDMPDEYVIKTPNHKKLRAEATSRKEHAKVDGVKFYPVLKARKASDKMTKRPW